MLDRFKGWQERSCPTVRRDSETACPLRYTISKSIWIWARVQLGKGHRRLPHACTNMRSRKVRRHWHAPAWKHTPRHTHTARTNTCTRICKRKHIHRRMWTRVLTTKLDHTQVYMCAFHTRPECAQLQRCLGAKWVLLISNHHLPSLRLRGGMPSRGMAGVIPT
jgi:hypothetical protein